MFPTFFLSTLTLTLIGSLLCQEEKSESIHFQGKSRIAYKTCDTSASCCDCWTHINEKGLWCFTVASCEVFSHRGNIDTEQTTGNCGFHPPVAHLSIFHFIAVEVGGFSQHAIKGHVPVKTRYGQHTHTLTSHTSFHETWDLQVCVCVCIRLLYLLCSESSAYLTTLNSYRNLLFMLLQCKKNLSENNWLEMSTCSLHIVTHRVVCNH